MRNLKPYKRPLDVRMWHHLCQFKQMLYQMDRPLEQLRVLTEALAAAKPELVPLPVWARRRTIYHLFGIPGRKLDQLLAEGVVRTVKLGQVKNSARLFRVEDVDRALLAIAAGRKPPRPQYRATRTAKRRAQGRDGAR